MTPSKFQILLVEDSEADARLFEDALHKAAPRVKLYWVATAEEGLEYLRQEKRFEGAGPVNLIVSDLNLSGMDGTEFLAAVKRDAALKSTPLVVYSGSSSARDINLCYALRANSYLVKPMTLDTMVDHIKVLVHYWLEVVSLPALGATD